MGVAAGNLRFAKSLAKRTLWAFVSLILGLTVLMQILPSTTTVIEFADDNQQAAAADGRTVIQPAKAPRAFGGVFGAGGDHLESNHAGEKGHQPAGGRERRPVESGEDDQQLIPQQERVGKRPIASRSTKHPPVTVDFSHIEMEFRDLLNKTPGKLSYPKAKSAYVDQLELHDEDSTEAWKIFQNGITKERLYNPNDPMIDQLLKDLQSLAIVSIEEPDAGTQIKLFVEFENGGHAVFKPQRYPRELARTGDNQFYFSEVERHNAEIATYHLDRVLGFYHVPPTVGRMISVTRDIQRLADEDFNRTIFVSPSGNKCFHGSCRYYCDTGHAICGDPDLVEGSFQAMIPMREEVPRHNNKSPWRRSYSKHYKADWEDDPYYCEEVVPKYGKSRFMLDLVDVYIFDFLNGNQDRHHIDTFKVFGNESAPVLFDNGRAFGEPNKDDLSILAPLTQCCIIRYSTLTKLLKFVVGPKKLSEAFIESSKKDLAYPLLTDDFYPALDRRLVTILRHVRKCLVNENFEDVVLDDDL